VSARPTVYTDPDLRARGVRFLDAIRAGRGVSVPEAEELVGCLVARVEELEALGRTPRLFSDEDERRLFEVSLACGCGRTFVYDPRHDVRESGSERFVACPGCGGHLRPPKGLDR
jgi:hypothetical protein